MKTVFTMMSLMLIAFLGYAQNGPITFEPGEEGADWTWEVFENDTNPDLEIIPNPDATGANTSATVAQFTALQTGAPFAGCQSQQTVDLGAFEWDSTNQTVKIMVWKSVISDVGIKFDTETGWSEGEILVPNTVVNEWEELTFDFSNAQNPPPGNGQLSRIVIFPDFNSGRSQDNIVYFDNVRFEEASAEPEAEVVGVDASANFLGFANVFETPANGGAFVFGSPWGVPDIKSVIDSAEQTVTLFPNFNTYRDNPDDPFWVDPMTGLGNKTFEGNTFVEDASLAGKTVTFEGEVDSYTLSSDYETKVYIKVFNSDFSVLKEVSDTLTEAGPFSITFDNPEAADAVVQYGFSVTGINANPDDEAALGNVVIVAGDGGTGPEAEVVGVDASADFLGFANVFETPANGGAFVFGSPWGVPDIKSVTDSAEQTVTLFPNFNTYRDNPDDPFWVDQMTGLGNKTFEGNTFVEDASLAGKTVTFEGEVASYTLSSDYLTKVYIKVFNSDFSVLKEVSDTLTEAGPFSITFDNPEAADAVVQYGFSVTGINANPDDEATLGNVVIVAGDGGTGPEAEVVGVDASADFLGFANVFETPANGGAFVFGSPWGVPDIKSVIDSAEQTVTLFPNFNTYRDNPADPFWVDQMTGLGNKTFEGNTFVEDTLLAGKTVTFEGEVASYTLSSDYLTKVYIKVFNSDFSVLKEVSDTLTEAGPFSITFDNPEAADAVVQYGFSVTGLNANPDDEAALGNVVIVAGDGGTGPEAEVVGVDASADFLGFANVFETPANGGAFVFGSPWGVPDIKSVIDSAEQTVTLFPNFNTYRDNPADPFWVDQMTGLGNKTFEGNTFVEDTLLAGKTVTFEGEVASYTLSSDYLTKVYIKVFNSDFSVLKEVSDTLTEAGPFSITFDNPEAADAVVQYGFSVTGLNANPDDEATLGNVVILGEGGGPVTDPQVAAPDPTELEENVLSLYSDTYTDVGVDTWLGPGSGADLEDIEIDGNATKKYTNVLFFGVETTNDNLIDASDMDFFHIDLWTPNIDTLKIRVIDWGADGELLGGDDSSHELTFTDLPQGQWNSLQIPMEDFEGLAARSNLAQYVITGFPSGEGTLFVDNVYFSKMPTSVVNPESIDVRIYPNPSTDFVILDSQTPVTSCVLYNMSGQRVLEKVNPGNKLDVNRIGAGLYIIEIETKEGMVRQRLIIQ